MPPIQNIWPSAGLRSAVIHPKAPTPTTIAKSDNVFMMTSSIVTRPVWTGPADGRSYMSCRCRSVTGPL